MLERLEAYVALLDKWRHVTNLISAASFEYVWQRHVADCLQLLDQLPTARRWLDIGSGAGFPGLVLAIQLADCDGAEIHCVESDGRKCAFLREVVRQLGLPAVVHNQRVETLDPETIAPIDAVTARALASTAAILDLSHEYLNRGATVILPRGHSAKHELEALDLSQYTIKSAANAVDQSGVVLLIRAKAEGLDDAGHQCEA
jgi:16S rRNA (guanine527-N7)-methyltransferase